jgi:hypothetical protein
MGRKIGREQLAVVQTAKRQHAEGRIGKIGTGRHSQELPRLKCLLIKFLGACKPLERTAGKREISHRFVPEAKGTAPSAVTDQAVERNSNHTIGSFDSTYQFFGSLIDRLEITRLVIG